MRVRRLCRRIGLTSIVTLLLFGLTLWGVTADMGVLVDTRDNYGYQVERTALGDLDGDGDLDFVTGNARYGSGWYRNRGDGTFGWGGSSLGPSGSGSKFCDLADLDRDGDLDVVFAGYSGVRYHLNKGDGIFGALTTVVDGARQNGLCTGDMNGDGYVDLIVTGEMGGGTGAIYLNDGQASFRAMPQSLLTSSEEAALATGDIDGDGDLDVSVGNALLRNDGTGQLSDSGQVLPVQSGRGRAFGDVDGDADLLAIADTVGPSVVLLGSEGSFAYSLQQSFPSANHAALADMDLDGDLDLVLQASDATYVYGQSEDGQFVQVQVLPAHGMYSQPAALSCSLGDLNGDLYPDLVQARANSGARVFLQNRPPNCSAAVASVQTLWPANHKLVDIEVLGVTDPEGDEVTLTVDSIYQDEPVQSTGDGAFAPDGRILEGTTAQVRAERSGNGNGRVYHITFTAKDVHSATCTSEVLATVPKSPSARHSAVDDGPLYDSTTVD